MVNKNEINRNRVDQPIPDNRNLFEDKLPKTPKSPKKDFGDSDDDEGFELEILGNNRVLNDNELENFEDSIPSEISNELPDFLNNIEEEFEENKIVLDN